MFATLFYERDLLQWTDLPAAVVSWFQDVGGLAALGLAVWVVVYLVNPAAREGGRRGLRTLIGVATAAAACFYAFAGILMVPDALKWLSASFGGESYVPAPFSPVWQAVYNVSLTAAGVCAVVAALLPFGADALRLRWRRIWAIARLTMKEVVRRRIPLVFLALALVFLFAAWFIDTKPETQVHSYVQAVYLSMAVLVVFTASLTSSFSIPTDIRQQTIHTVLTKPVEPYEIVLGRFLGYVVMMTLALVVMTTLSLAYVFRNIDKDAADESLKARVPVYGDLKFEGTGDENKGENVGDEWEYRTYISGPTPQQPTQYAVWSLDDLPRDLASREQVPLEFTFNIYRTTTGEVGKGVFCAVEVQSWRWTRARKDEYDKRRKQGGGPELDNQLAQELGYYELPSKEVVNYHTQAITIPAGVFKNHFASRDELKPRLQELQKKQKEAELSAAEAEELSLLEKDARGEARPPLKVKVRCLSRTQFLGMAKADLYLLAAEQPFWANFYKGMVGIWLWMLLVIGVAVVCSTYINGPITWLCVMVLFGLGLFRDYVQAVSLRANEGGGPAESLVRLFNRQAGSVPLDENVAAHVATGSDEVFRWTMRRFLSTLPDANRFDFTDRVANGFNVPVLHGGGNLVLTFIYLIGYLIPWLVLGYYLIKKREIAGAT